jgi:acyl-CoA synthetase (AMP-forming)/AMP-acid ligase II/acyl carrier protein
MNCSAYDFKPATLIDILGYRATHQPDQIAYTFLIDGEREEISLTYQALDQRARSIAADLRSSNSGERVLLLYPPGLEYISAFFGCLYADMVAVPAYPPRSDRLSRLQAIVADAQATIVLTNQGILTKLKSKLAQNPDLNSLKWVATDLLPVDQTPIAVDADGEGDRDPEALALLQYTSGSTATPKGVMVSHRNLLHNLDSIQRCFGHTPQSKGVIWLPPYHDMGLVGGVLQPLYSGFPVVLMSPLMFMQNPMRWLKAISHYRATTSGGPNFAYEQCIRQLKSKQMQAIDLSCWQVAFNGAEPIRYSTLQRFAAVFEPYGFRLEAFYPCYGMAEATLMISGGVSHRAIATHAVDRDQKPEYSLVSCGQSLTDQQVLIVHSETQILCKSGEIGEIWVSGPSVAQGYWRQPEATQQTFQADLADQTGPFLRTGDLGFLQKGELFVTGRLKDLIVIRGKNHYPQDIELTVQRCHPALSLGGGAAFSIETDGVEQLVILQEVERNSLRQLDVNSVFQSIRQAVSEQHQLQVDAIALLKPKSLPKTSSGKIQRYLCRANFLAASLQTIAVWQTPIQLPNLAQEQITNHAIPSALTTAKRATPPTEAEIQDWLTTNLAMYLKVETAAIETTAPFAQYGLDSSVAVSLTGELAEWLELTELEPTLFWEYPSIDALAQYLSAEIGLRI